MTEREAEPAAVEDTEDVTERPPGSLQPGARAAIWTFLNSTFALWLLSTVAVGGGTWVYQ